MNKPYVIQYQIRENGKVLESMEVSETLDGAMDDLTARLSVAKPWDTSIEDIIILNGRLAIETVDY